MKFNKLFGNKQSKKLKGTTLIEIVIYLGLFGFIFTTIILFFYAISEFNRNNKYTIDVEKQSIFVVEHLEESFKKANTIDQLNSQFDSDNGSLTLIKSDGSTIKYSISNNRVLSTTTTTDYLTSADFTITKLRFEKVLNGTTLIGVKFELTLNSVKVPRISKDITYTYVLQ